MKSQRPQFDLPPSPPPHKRKGSAAKIRRQEKAQERRDAHPTLYKDMR